MLGYSRIEQFRRDLKKQLIPAPTRFLRGNPVWSREALQRWVNGEDEGESGTKSLDDNLQRIA